jgi:hypothetical protein
MKRHLDVRPPMDDDFAPHFEGAGLMISADRDELSVTISVIEEGDVVCSCTMEIEEWRRLAAQIELHVNLSEKWSFK